MKRATLLLAALCCLLSGCSLLPQEDEIRNVPLVPEYSAPSYSTVTVERGDLIQEYSIACLYTKLRQEPLKFSVEGVGYGQFYASVGQQVKAGQLMAELDTTLLDEKIAACQTDLHRNELQLQTLEKNRELALERRTLSMQGSDPDRLKEALAEVNAQYDRQRGSLDDEKALLNLELEGFMAQRDQYQIYAGIDGVVTYAHSPKRDDTSRKGFTVMIITDPSSCIFKAETQFWDHFTPEETTFIATYVASVDASGKFTSTPMYYESTLVSEQELGLPETEKIPGQLATIYFRLNDPGITIKETSPHFITLELDSRKDVLLLPEEVISSVDGKSIVYCLGQGGVLEIRYIETGMISNGYVEILSGLSEGDTVVQR